MLSYLPKVTKLVEPGLKPRHGNSMSSRVRPGVQMSTMIMAKGVKLRMYFLICKMEMKLLQEEMDYCIQAPKSACHTASPQVILWLVTNLKFIFINSY